MLRKRMLENGSSEEHYSMKVSLFRRACESIRIGIVADSRLGTSARVQAFLDKARSGKAFTVASIGGSGMCLQDLYMYVRR